LLELETAIHKMSLLPAQRIGLTDRGCIAPGMAADLVVFDPASVRDRATYEDPHQYPEGIAWVFIRGEAIVDHQEHTGALAGQVLTRR
jgi:N-acyl-D-aspartate/D-glutamate deacylase